MSDATRAADAAAIEALLPSAESRQAMHARAVSLMIRNAMLEAIDRERERAAVSKKDLAERAGLDYAAVRRLLTTNDSNPTLGTVAQLLAASRIRLQLVTEAGDVIDVPERDTLDQLPA
jgi:ribosome-binding protein aMBF1 (putative translation factor)